jgi:hypothetical protein
MRRIIGLIVAVAIPLAAAPAGADAQVTRKKAIWGPIERNGVSQFPIYADLGAGIYQMTLRWDQVAKSRPANPHDPADPAYEWPAGVDLAIEQARPFGIQVMLLLLGAPPWANGGRAWNFAPTRPGDFAAFAEATSRRYPAVRHWMVWSEPTKADNFQPLSPDHGRPLRGKALRGPRLYARMLDASYAALKRVSTANLVIGGNTFTVGTVSPLRFINALKLPNGRPPRMDLWGHNAFSLREPRVSAPALGNGYADFSELRTLMRWLDRAMRRAREPKQRRLRIFISEFSLPTDHSNHEFNFYVTRETQADWLSKALHIVRNDRRLYTFGYLGLYDDEPRPGGDQVDRGLITLDGTRKPGYEAFKRG